MKTIFYLFLFSLLLFATSVFAQHEGHTNPKSEKAVKKEKVKGKVKTKDSLDKKNADDKMQEHDMSAMDTSDAPMSHTMTHAYSLNYP